MLEFFNNRTESMVALLEQLVRYESPSRDKVLVDRLGDYLSDLLTSVGATVTTYPRETVGDLRLAKWNSDAPGQPILLLCHMDTVWPDGTLAGRVPLRREDGKLYGPGTLDMKSGIVIAIEAIRGLQERGEFPNRPIWMLLTTDEEIHSLQSKDSIVEIAEQCGLVLCMEPATSSGGLKTWRKGIAEYHITARGLASHAGNAPEEGINAVVELAHQTIRLDGLNQLRKGTSVSVTLFSGGVTNNTIPPEAHCTVDVRFLIHDEARRIDEAVRDLQPVLPGSKLEIEGGINRPPLERDETMIHAFEQAKQLADEVGVSIYEDGSGGGSDGSFSAAAGVMTLDGLGAHGDGLHALHEHVIISSLPRRAAHIAAILRNWKF